MLRCSNTPGSAEQQNKADTDKARIKPKYDVQMLLARRWVCVCERQFACLFICVSCERKYVKVVYCWCEGWSSRPGRFVWCLACSLSIQHLAQFSLTHTRRSPSTAWPRTKEFVKRLARHVVINLQRNQPIYILDGQSRSCLCLKLPMQTLVVKE